MVSQQVWNVGIDILIIWVTIGDQSSLFMLGHIWVFLSSSGSFPTEQWSSETSYCFVQGILIQWIGWRGNWTCFCCGGNIFSNIRHWWVLSKSVIRCTRLNWLRRLKKTFPDLFSQNWLVFNLPDVNRFSGEVQGTYVVIHNTCQLWEEGWIV